ncbi:MAG TPA: gluconokinase, partial [Rhodanobacteraceae bacterium]
MVIVVMGVTGAGKTTIGSALAGTLGWRFVDGDDLHPSANVAKMRAGVPLTDADRAPWLAAIEAVIARAIERREHLVIACSALKQHYREILRDGRHGVRFVYLDVTPAVAVARASHRTGHFAGPALVASQFAALEPPADAFVVDGTSAPEHI